jgi:hypothetical protein
MNRRRADWRRRIRQDDDCDSASSRTNRAEDIARVSRGIPSMFPHGPAQTSGFDIVSAQRVHEVLRARPGHRPVARSQQVSEIARRTGAGAVVVGNIFRADRDAHDAQLGMFQPAALPPQSVRGTDLFSMTDQLAVAFPHGSAPAAWRGAERDRGLTASLSDRLISQGLTLPIKPMGRGGRCWSGRCRSTPASRK